MSKTRTRTGERLNQIEMTLKMMERDLESLSRAMWRAGIRIPTNEASP